jgi:hypothetical protein
MTRTEFERGMTPAEYLSQMGVNKDRFVRTLEATAVGPDDLDVLERHGPARKILVITEDWCGTSLLSVPYAFKLAESDPRLEVRVFLRDENPELMDRYLKHGQYRSIPVVVFLDEGLRELARFIEARPA